MTVFKEEEEYFDGIQLVRRHFDKETPSGWGTLSRFKPLSHGATTLTLKLSFNSSCLSLGVQLSSPPWLLTLNLAEKRLNIKLAPLARARRANDKHLLSLPPGGQRRQRDSPEKFTGRRRRCSGGHAGVCGHFLTPLFLHPPLVAPVAFTQPSTHLVGTFCQLGHFLHAARHV